jgi:hypothetical protein
MFSIFSLLYFALALATPGTAPSNAAPAGASSTTVSNCYCQTMPMKDWGK